MVSDCITTSQPASSCRLHHPPNRVRAVARPGAGRERESGSHIATFLRVLFQQGIEQRFRSPETGACQLFNRLKRRHVLIVAAISICHSRRSRAEFLKTGNGIIAIKSVREIPDPDVREAKSIVDSWQK